jgi:hypothetical protein
MGGSSRVWTAHDLMVNMKKGCPVMDSPLALIFSWRNQIFLPEAMAVHLQARRIMPIIMMDTSAMLGEKVYSIIFSPSAYYLSLYVEVGFVKVLRAGVGQSHFVACTHQGKGGHDPHDQWGGSLVEE